MFSLWSVWILNSEKCHQLLISSVDRLPLGLVVLSSTTPFTIWKSGKKDASSPFSLTTANKKNHSISQLLSSRKNLGRFSSHPPILVIVFQLCPTALGPYTSSLSFLNHVKVISTSRWLFRRSNPTFTFKLRQFSENNCPIKSSLNPPTLKPISHSLTKSSAKILSLFSLLTRSPTSPTTYSCKSEPSAHRDSNNFQSQWTI